VSDIFTENALPLFIAFVVPGFVTLRAYELLSPTEYRASSERIVEAVSYSCINYAFLIWPIIGVESHGYDISHPFLYALFYFFALLVFPVGLAFGWFRLRKLDFIRKTLGHPTDTAWEYFFEEQKAPCWVVITLKSGDQVGGYYGRKSFASGHPSPLQIYLEKAWEINECGGLERELTDTNGILVMHEEIRTMNFYDVTFPKQKEEEDEEGRGRQDQEGPPTKGAREG
jgi:hypothetical protein